MSLVERGCSQFPSNLLEAFSSWKFIRWWTHLEVNVPHSRPISLEVILPIFFIQDECPLFCPSMAVPWPESYLAVLKCCGRLDSRQLTASFVCCFNKMPIHIPCLSLYKKTTSRLVRDQNRSTREIFLDPSVLVMVMFLIVLSEIRSWKSSYWRVGGKEMICFLFIRSCSARLPWHRTTCSSWCLHTAEVTDLSYASLNLEPH